MTRKTRAHTMEPITIPIRTVSILSQEDIFFICITTISSEWLPWHEPTQDYVTHYKRPHSINHEETRMGNGERGKFGKEHQSCLNEASLS